MTFSHISFSAWNINALSHKTLGDKLQNSINSCDFIVLTETWNRSQIEISLYPPTRNSFDNIINNNGKRLLHIYKNSDLKNSNWTHK